MAEAFTRSFIGIDIGTQKTMVVRDDAEIIRTSSGSISRPSLIYIHEKTRMVGEEALAQVSGAGTVAMINKILGLLNSSAKNSPVCQHQKVGLKCDEKDRLFIEVAYNGSNQLFHPSALLAILLSRLLRRAIDFNGPNIQFSFVLPVDCNQSAKVAVRDAIAITGFQPSQVKLVDTADCLTAAYNRKIGALPAVDTAYLQGKHVLIVDMGHGHCTAVVVQVEVEDFITPLGKEEKRIVGRKVSVASDQELGGFYFDIKLFEHFQLIVSKKGSEVLPGSKRGARLLSACEKLRKLLSQLHDASITVENLTDDVDLSFSLKRDELAKLCSNEFNKFKDLLNKALSGINPSLGESPDGFTSELAAVEIVGGATRAPSIQATIHEVVASYNKSVGVENSQQIPLGAKLDDGSVALGAALVCKKIEETQILSDEAKGESLADKSVEGVENLENVVDSTGLTVEEIQLATEKEKEMQVLDKEIKDLQDARNRIEAYYLEMRAATSNYPKHAHLIDQDALNLVLEEYESWLWDSDDSYEAPLSVLNEKYEAIKRDVGNVCKGFFEAIEEAKKEMEKSLEVESALAAAERAANGEEEEDHDNRKLKKPDRMRLVVKNKEEGTELFKGGNIRPAAARYHKALTHTAKFFDLSQEDIKEVDALKLSLYLNLASCYIKLQQWEQVLRNCEEALKIDGNNVKALFRRSSYFESKKDWNAALEDIKRCLEYVPEDKLIVKASERVKKEIAKEKNKEKKMWGKAFA